MQGYCLVGTAIWRTDEECICGESKFLKNKKNENLSAEKAYQELHFFKKKFFLNGSPFGDPSWRTA